MFSFVCLFNFLVNNLASVGDEISNLVVNQGSWFMQFEEVDSSKGNDWLNNVEHSFS